MPLQAFCAPPEPPVPPLGVPPVPPELLEDDEVDPPQLNSESVSANVANSTKRLNRLLGNRDFLWNIFAATAL